MKRDQSHVEPREPSVSQGRDSIAQESDGEEDQENLVRLASKDANAGCGLENVDTTNEEESCTKVHGESDCNVANDEQPTTDPTGKTAPFGWGQHEGLVVYT